MNRERTGGPCAVVRWLSRKGYSLSSLVITQSPLPDILDQLATSPVLIEKLSINSNRSLWTVVLVYRNAISKCKCLGRWLLISPWATAEVPAVDTYPTAVPKQRQSGFDKKPLGIHGQWKSELRILTYPWKWVTCCTREWLQWRELAPGKRLCFCKAQKHKAKQCIVY